MSDAVSHVLQDLIEVREELDRLPADAFAERAELHQRQEELRARARDIRHAAHDGLTADQIRQRIAHLEARIEGRLDEHLGSSAAAGTGMGGGIDPNYVHALDHQLDEAVHLDDLKEELRRLRNRLDEMEESGD